MSAPRIKRKRAESPAIPNGRGASTTASRIRRHEVAVHSGKEVVDAASESVMICVACGAPRTVLGFYVPSSPMKERLAVDCLAYGLCDTCQADPDIIPRVEKIFQFDLHTSELVQPVEAGVQ